MNILNNSIFNFNNNFQTLASNVGKTFLNTLTQNWIWIVAAMGILFFVILLVVLICACFNNDSKEESNAEKTASSNCSKESSSNVADLLSIQNLASKQTVNDTYFNLILNTRDEVRDIKKQLEFNEKIETASKQDEKMNQLREELKAEMQKTEELLKEQREEKFKDKIAEQQKEIEELKQQKFAEKIADIVATKNENESSDSLKKNEILSSEQISSLNEEIKPVQEMVSPTQEVIEPVQEVSTYAHEEVKDTETATSMQETDSTVQEITTTVQETVKPVQEIVIPVQVVVKPVQEVSAPVQEIANASNEQVAEEKPADEETKANPRWERRTNIDYVNTDGEDTIEIYERPNFNDIEIVKEPDSKHIEIKELNNKDYILVEKPKEDETIEIVKKPDGKLVSNDSVIIDGVQKFTLREAYNLLSAKQKSYFDKLVTYASSKPNGKIKETKTYISVGNGNKNYIQLTIKKNTVVACFHIENEELFKLRLDGESVIRPEKTKVKIVNDEAYDAAIKMIDIRVEEVAREIELIKEARREKQRLRYEIMKSEKQKNKK